MLCLKSFHPHIKLGIKADISLFMIFISVDFLVLVTGLTIFNQGKFGKWPLPLYRRPTFQIIASCNLLLLQPWCEPAVQWAYIEREFKYLLHIVHLRSNSVRMIFLLYEDAFQYIESKIIFIYNIFYAFAAVLPL